MVNFWITRALNRGGPSSYVDEMGHKSAPLKPDKTVLTYEKQQQNNLNGQWKEKQNWSLLRLCALWLTPSSYLFLSFLNYFGLISLISSNG